MNKLITSSILIFCMMFFSACSLGGSRIKMLNGNRDDAKVNARLEQVIEAIKNKDKDAIKSLFSKKALSEANDFDGSVNDLFDLFQGEVDTWKKTSGPTVHESNNHGSKKKKVSSYYYVNTDKQKYFFC
jgi:septation ring formation regulator EzrA